VIIRPPTPGNVLHELLEAGRRFSGSYGGGLANHLPMALVALQGLGAVEMRLREFASLYEKRLRAKARFENVERQRSIDASMASVTGVPAFTEYCGPVRDLDLSQLTRIAVSIYLATADFTALHLVTACHATRVLGRYLSDEALNHLMIAMLAAY